MIKDLHRDLVCFQGHFKGVQMRHALGVILLFLVGSAQAALIDRGEGFIYDDILDITWTQNANINSIDTWHNQVAWADGYSQTHSVYGTFDDWRLADIDVNGDDTIVDCSIAPEALCQDNEYGYLYHQYGISSSSPGLFTNVQSDGYWSGTEYAPNPIGAWAFFFGDCVSPCGFGGGFGKGDGYYAWAVRAGDVAAVPVPAAVWLFGSGLGLLGWFRRKQS